MAHPRKLIRQAVVALLLAAGTAAGDRVKGTRVEPHKKSALPAIGVYTLNDPVVEETSSETEELHELELEVVGWVAHTEALSVDDAMDDLAEQIEAAMKVDPYLGGKAGDTRLVGTIMQVVEDNGGSNPLVGEVVLTYVVEYRKDLTAGGTLDDLLTVNATHKVVGGIEGDTVPAIDTFTVQEIAP